MKSLLALALIAATGFAQAETINAFIVGANGISIRGPAMTIQVDSVASCVTAAKNMAEVHEQRKVYYTCIDTKGIVKDDGVCIFTRYRNKPNDVMNSKIIEVYQCATIDRNSQSS